jgi:small subunit ribosomal protein S4e
MKHLKRRKIPKNWPIPKKGTKYIIKPNFGLNKGLPLLIALRDVLKVAKNRKEVKKAIHEKNILINGKPVKDEKDNMQLFDKITLVPSKKNYELVLSSNGKFSVEETKSDINEKVAKIIDKKILKGKKVQLNLSDGRNFISDTKCKVNDSVVVDLKNKKISKCLPLKEGANILVIAGKHTGEKGKIRKLKTERKMISFKNEGKDVDILIKQTMVII